MKTERLAAIRKLVAGGKPLGEVLDALSPAWNLSVWERAELEHTVATAPVEDRAAARLAHKSANEAAQERARQDDSEALEAFRYHQQLKQHNPFLAAQHRLQFASQIDRGSELNELLTEPEPPAAA